jgi:hypothetical protein
MLGDGDEAILVRHVERLAQRGVYALCYRFAVAGGFALPERDADERDADFPAIRWLSDITHDCE